jgi:hypothetical protein
LAVLQLGKDLVGELLSELHAPLVEAEDVPDHPLDKNLVLIQGNPEWSWLADSP